MGTRDAPPAVPRSAEELVEHLATPGPMLVALSGGVDSSVVAHLARRADPERTVAVTLTGPAISAAEVDRATGVARSIGVVHALVPVDPLASESYRSNPSNRCYFCRSVETAALRRFGLQGGVLRFLDGVHRDDLGDDRPGLQALEEAGFEHPLLWAGWGKSDVRSYARRVGLPNWDAPSDACLASRVRHGLPIDAGLLARIDAAESGIRARGYRRVRVRVTPQGARVEVDPDELARLLEAPETERVLAGVRSHGFADVVIDPRGYGHRANA